MKRSVVIALGISAVLAIYFAIGTVTAADNSSVNDVAEPVKQNPKSPPKAIVSILRSEPHPVVLSLKGQTEPDKIVTVKSGTVGTVVSTPAREGAFVKKGDVLCGLDVEARRAQLQQAKAMQSSARIDYDAAVALAKKGLTPANREAAAKAALDAASATVSAAEIELSKTQIRAPFSGIFETRMAETGDFLNPGQACGILVDLSPIIVTAQVAEEQATELAPGQMATANIGRGQSYPAKLRYVARTADARTRTFGVEAELKTGDARIPAGVTSELRIQLPEVEATLLSPALLSISDSGGVGLRYVDSNDIVQFVSVNVIDDSEDGIWVTGLPSEVRAISAGQEYFSDGLKVEPVLENNADGNGPS